MNLLDIVRRQPCPDPWAEGEKIPWNDPDFSRRMLREHLSQDHDAASRRLAIIDRQVAWIHQQLLHGKPARVLDLGCGPGLYTSRLARLGHACVGIDFSPASVAHARQEAQRDGLACRYEEGDMRSTAYGTGYDLVMLLFGECNVFHPRDAEAILRKSHAALATEGTLLLEPHTFEAVRQMGEAGASWYSTAQGLFSAEAHLCLYESFWDNTQQVATERYYVIEAESGEVQRYAASTQAYQDEAYRRMVENSGFGAVAFYPSLQGTAEAAQAGFLALVAQKDA